MSTTKVEQGRTHTAQLTSCDGPHSRRRNAAIVATALLLAGCASSNQWGPPKTEQPSSELSAKFLNVRHEPGAAWGKGGFRPRLEICEGRKPGCGMMWCYDCPDNGATRQWKISDTSVGAVLALPTQEMTITAYTNEKAGECKADPLTIAPKKKLQYELVYSHVWSGSDHKSYRCAATLERADQAPAEPAPEGSEGTEGPEGDAGGPEGTETPEAPAPPPSP